MCKSSPNYFLRYAIKIVIVWFIELLSDACENSMWSNQSYSIDLQSHKESKRWNVLISSWFRISLLATSRDLRNRGKTLVRAYLSHSAFRTNKCFEFHHQILAIFTWVYILMFGNINSRRQRTIDFISISQVRVRSFYWHCNYLGITRE